MPIDCIFDAARDLIVMRGFGEVTLQDSLDVIDKTVNASNGAAINKNVLFVMDGRASLHQLDLASITAIKSSIQKWLTIYPRRAIKCALVNTDPAHIAFGELWRAISEAEPTIGSETKSFATEVDALAWLAV